MFLGAGALEVATMPDWDPGTDPVVTWGPSPASLAKAQQAPVSDVPISYIQAQHLRGLHEFADRGLDYSRLVAGSWDIPGRCDVRAMTYVINTHLRRHDTYRSWFEYDDGEIVRHTLTDPKDIDFVATRHESMTKEQWGTFLADIPDPRHWDCLRFAVIQHADCFTFCVLVDHLHTDPTLMPILYMEAYVTYMALAAGAAPAQLPPTASYEDFCVRQREYAASLTVDSPEIRRWIAYAECNGGTLPDFPLPLGDLSVASGGDIVCVKLMDGEQTARFESACLRAGARLSGGLFACAALTHYELTGDRTYYGLTPLDNRSGTAELMTAGWFTGIVPFVVSVDPESFGDTARAAQDSFDENLELAKVPFDRVLELAPRLRRPGPNFTMLNYMDAGLPPLSAVVASQLDGAHAATYCDGRDPAHLYMSVGRLFDEVSATVFFPNNPVARESVMRHVETLRAVCQRAAAGTEPVASYVARDVSECAPAGID